MDCKNVDSTMKTRRAVIKLQRLKRIADDDGRKQAKKIPNSGGVKIEKDLLRLDKEIQEQKAINQLDQQMYKDKMTMLQSSVRNSLMYDYGKERTIMIFDMWSLQYRNIVIDLFMSVKKDNQVSPEVYSKVEKLIKDHPNATNNKNRIMSMLANTIKEITDENQANKEPFNRKIKNRVTPIDIYKVADSIMKESLQPKKWITGESAVESVSESPQFVIEEQRKNLSKLNTKIRSVAELKPANMIKDVSPANPKSNPASRSKVYNTENRCASDHMLLVHNIKTSHRQPLPAEPLSAINHRRLSQQVSAPNYAHSPAASVDDRSSGARDDRDYFKSDFHQHCASQFIDSGNRYYITRSVSYSGRHRDAILERDSGVHACDHDRCHASRRALMPALAKSRGSHVDDRSKIESIIDTCQNMVYGDRKNRTLQSFMRKDNKDIGRIRQMWGKSVKDQASVLTQRDFRFLKRNLAGRVKNVSYG
jgi:hypothetical protein